MMAVSYAVHVSNGLVLHAPCCVSAIMRLTMINSASGKTTLGVSTIARRGPAVDFSKWCKKASITQEGADFGIDVRTHRNNTADAELTVTEK